MSDYKPSLGTRLRWTFIVVTVIFIAVMIYAAIHSDDAKSDNCWTAHQTKKVESVLGTDLAKARMVKRWCGNGNRVTDVKDVDVFHKVTLAGTITGWVDEGVKDRDSNYIIWRNTAQGGHVSRATVCFHRNGAKLFDDEECKHLRIEVHADGSNSADGFGDGGGAW
jgi:hypothetical protein